MQHVHGAVPRWPHGIQRGGKGAHARGLFVFYVARSCVICFLICLNIFMSTNWRECSSHKMLIFCEHFKYTISISGGQGAPEIYLNIQSQEAKGLVGAGADGLVFGAATPGRGVDVGACAAVKQVKGYNNIIMMITFIEVKA